MFRLRPVVFFVMQLMLIPLVVAPAIAHGPVPVPTEPLVTPLTPLGLSTCQLIPFPPGTALNAWGDEDRWETVYHLVRPSDCPDCAGGPIQIDSIVYESRTAGDPSCVQQVEVAVYGAIDGACPVPDPSVVICPPTVVDVTVLDTTTPIVVPLPAGCCVDGPAYVRLRWLNDEFCGSPLLHPYLRRSDDPCVECAQYYTTTVQFPTLTEMCAGAFNNRHLEVNAQCCQPTPALERSWGRVKVLYR